MNSYKNTSELKKFIAGKKLQDHRSNIRFTAEIEIQTSQNSLNIEKEVIIKFDGYDSAGKLTIIDSNSEIDPDLFPEDFEGKWQDFQYIDNHYLKITGTHPGTKIGKYHIKIFPVK